ncbi:preprotein translocase subunit YajC [Granulicatella balaenopterae]|uniref:Preprotein translocase subunit YajC n=1 Tax=Granulicatella balaenopterae TaxID=137733 RepID=A0A1H9MWY3_9LACT|nr:preprotein translocase subunit YajC [Granulicatella balaenopterae]SER27915.1 preprotein translocase subunit YajC [Granulicatella balaenopterae]
MSTQLIILIYVALGLMYILVVRKKKKRDKEHLEKMKNLEVGAHIVTVGGLHGIVSEIDNEEGTVVLDCEGIYLTFERKSVLRVVEESAEEVVTPEIESEPEVEEVTEDNEAQ